jgi:phage-related protein
VSINIGSYSFTLSGIEAGVPVLVDCDAMTVTNVNQSVSYIQNMVGQFPRLVPGNNVVTHSGTVTSIVIRPRYRWL